MWQRASFRIQVEFASRALESSWAASWLRLTRISPRSSNFAVTADLASITGGRRSFPAYENVVDVVRGLVADLTAVQVVD
jgi:hypothetical protein